MDAIDKSKSIADHPDDAMHVASCPECQALASLEDLRFDLDNVWAGVAAEVWARPVKPIERFASRLLGSPGLARALVTTPSLLLSWIVASAAVLIVGALVTLVSGTAGIPWVALLAPALAGAGIAYAYGPGIDPAFELSQSMPISDRMVLLVRGLTVFGLNAALGLAASLFTAGAVGITFGWLVPMTTICALALAGATLARSPNVGVAAALSGWAIIILVATGITHDLASAVAIVLQGALVPWYAAATIVFVLAALYATNSNKKEARQIL
jgi:hypothetical protein